MLEKRVLENKINIMITFRMYYSSSIKYHLQENIDQPVL